MKNHSLNENNFPWNMFIPKRNLISREYTLDGRVYKSDPFIPLMMRELQSVDICIQRNNRVTLRKAKFNIL